MVLANWEIKTTNRPNLKFADRTERCETRRDSCAMGGNGVLARANLEKRNKT
jgi:hypothetical protein